MSNHVKLTIKCQFNVCIYLDQKKMFACVIRLFTFQRFSRNGQSLAFFWSKHEQWPKLKRDQDLRIPKFIGLIPFYTVNLGTKTIDDFESNFLGFQT